MSSKDARHFTRNLAFVALLFGVISSQAGCVALNIPSERLHDATDHGGMFGDWRKHRHIADNSHAGSSSHHRLHAHHALGADSSLDGVSLAGHHCNDPSCVLDHHFIDGQGIHGARFAIDGGPLEEDPFGPVAGSNGAASESEIPWPRFHPIPTRPVFGVSSQ